MSIQSWIRVATSFSFRSKWEFLFDLNRKDHENIFSKSNIDLVFIQSWVSNYLIYKFFHLVPMLECYMRKQSLHNRIQIINKLRLLNCFEYLFHWWINSWSCIYLLNVSSETVFACFRSIFSFFLRSHHLTQWFIACGWLNFVYIHEILIDFFAFLSDEENERLHLSTNRNLSLSVS